MVSLGLHPNPVLRDDERRLGPGKPFLSLREWETRLSVMENVRCCISRPLGLILAEQLWWKKCGPWLIGCHQKE